MPFLDPILASLKSTLIDIAPILLVLFFFQVVIIRRKVPNLKRILVGLILVVVGLAVFIVGLEQGIFPMSFKMADQLTDLRFLTKNDTKTVESVFETGRVPPELYAWTYTFGFLIGFSTTLAEPALIAVALKASQISTGAVSAWGLRIAVALGVAIGVSLGIYRIVSGTPLYTYIIGGYIILLIQTYFAPKAIVALAYDSGGVTTSTVTVPVLAALGIGLATNVPGRSPLLDGFGLIAFASLFPMMAVLAYAMISEWRVRRTAHKNNP